MLLDVVAHSRAPSYARHDGCPIEFDFTKRDDIAIVLKASYEASMYVVLPSTARLVFIVGYRSASRKQAPDGSSELVAEREMHMCSLCRTVDNTSRQYANLCLGICSMGRTERRLAKLHGPIVEMLSARVCHNA